MATWTPERRAAQAELIRRLKPWEKSTGPRTANGKAKAGRNSRKHGLRSAPARDIAKARTAFKQEGRANFAAAEKVMREALRKGWKL